VIDPRTSTQSKSTILPSHIAETPSLRNRTDHEARQMSERTSPGEVLIAIKESHEEMVARSNNGEPAPEPPRER